MAFPFATTSGVFIYDVSTIDRESPGDLTIDRLHEAVGDRLSDLVVPERLDSTNAAEWSWCWLDGQNPVSAGRWLVWGIRSWEKRVPPSLVKAVTAERVSEWRDDNPALKVSAAVRSQIKSDVDRELTAKTTPSIRVDPIALDTSNWRLLLFNPGPKAREAIRFRVHELLAEAMNGPLRLTEWTLDNYLTETRHGAVLPTELGAKLLWWLTEKAWAERWCELGTEAGDPIFLGLVLDDTITVQVRDGAHSVKGSTATEEYTTTLTEKNGDNRVTKIKFGLVMRRDGERKRFTFTVDQHGQLTNCVCETAKRIPTKDDNLDHAVVERGDDYAWASEAMGLLFQAFDHGPIREWLDSAPQVSMFMGHSVGTVTWHNTAPFADADEDPDDKQGDLFTAGDKSEAHALGFKDGLLQTSGNNPFEDESDEFDAYIEGWQAGQAKSIDGADEGHPAQKPAKKKRRTRKKPEATA